MASWGPGQTALWLPLSPLLFAVPTGGPLPASSCQPALALHLHPGDNPEGCLVMASAGCENLPPPRFFLLKLPMSLGPTEHGTSSGRDPSIKEPSRVRRNTPTTRKGPRRGPQQELPGLLGMMDRRHPATLGPCLWDAQTAVNPPGPSLTPATRRPSTSPRWSCCGPSGST